MRFYAKKIVPLHRIIGKKMAKKKILFINQEIAPYVPDTTMSVVGRDLPRAMQERNNETRTFMPKWGNINERRGQLHEVIRLSGMNLIINDTDHPLIIKVASIPSTRVQVFFIDNDDYFSKRQMVVNDDEADNGERAVFFARGVLETVKKQGWIPDIIHCQGWMSCLVPFYIKTAYQDEPSFANTKIITSIFPKETPKVLGTEFKQTTEFRTATPDLLGVYKDNFDTNELAKLSIDYSDGVLLATADSDPVLVKYAKEKGLPIQNYLAENFGETYEAFYDSICPEQQE